MTGKYLISTDSWFFCPDGQQYKAVWGEVQIIDDSLLGIKTNRNATNWFAKIGTPSNHVIVAGCQIHYAVKCDTEPNSVDYEDYEVKDGVVLNYKVKSKIYLAK